MPTNTPIWPLSLCQRKKRGEKKEWERFPLCHPGKKEKRGGAFSSFLSSAAKKKGEGGWKGGEKVYALHPTLGLTVPKKGENRKGPTFSGRGRKRKERWGVHASGKKKGGEGKGRVSAIA